MSENSTTDRKMVVKKSNVYELSALQSSSYYCEKWKRNGGQAQDHRRDPGDSIFLIRITKFDLQVHIEHA